MNFITTLAANPVDHVTDKKLLPVDVGFWVGTDGSNLWVFSNATIMLILGALVTMALVIPAARRIRTGQARSLEDYRAQGLLANLVEGVCLYLRNDVFRPILQDKTDQYTPMLWTLFWFILVCNLLGLIPFLDATAMLGWGYHGHGIGGTATQSIWVTGALALIAAIFYMGNAMREDFKGFLHHLTGGTPAMMWVIMVPVELLGYLIKPFALAIRLFANMTGGHLVIAVLLSFVPAVLQALGPASGGAVSVVAVIGATAINFLEVLVAFIQAYIFAFLTCLFLGQLVVHEHEEHHHEHEQPIDELGVPLGQDAGIPAPEAHA